jgi:hypothetical protein
LFGGLKIQHIDDLEQNIWRQMSRFLGFPISEFLRSLENCMYMEASSSRTQI